MGWNCSRYSFDYRRVRPGQSGRNLRHDAGRGLSRSGCPAPRSAITSVFRSTPPPALHAEAWDASLLTLPEYQCRVHPIDYVPSFFNIRIWEERDKDSQQLIAYPRAPRGVGHRAHHLDGWTPASAGLRAAHLAGLFDRQVGRRNPDRHDDSSEAGLDPAQRHPAQRSRDRVRKLHPARRPSDVDDRDPRSRLSDRAVHPHARFPAEPRPGDGRVSVRKRGRGGDAEGQDSAPPAGHERVPRRVSRAIWNTHGSGHGRGGNDVSRVSAES